MGKLINFAISARVVGGRPAGRETRQRILEIIQAAPPDAVLRIDLSRVETLDFSAADELLTGLIARVVSGELDTRRFYLTGAAEGVREGVNAALKLRKRVCLDLTESGCVNVLGQLSAPHHETLLFAIERGTVTAADVANRFWKEANMTAATNRLNTLVAAGLLLRDIEQSGPRGTRNLYRAFIREAGSRETTKPERDP